MQDLGFISHAHSDHFARHRTVFATKETALLIRDRLGPRSRVEVVDMNRPFELGDARITLFPAGHMLGSAQILVERGGRRLVYTGDFCLEGGFTSPPAEVRKCDELIMESTYGLPQYRFPPKSETVEKLEKFIRKARDQGGTPVLLAYTLGKSQELMKALGDRGITFSVHPKIHAATLLYEELGVAFRPFRRFPEQFEPGDTVLLPPHSLRSSEIWSRVPKPRLAQVTGWAVDGRPIGRARSYPSFPWSDHSDFPHLLEYVNRAAPEVVITTHGFDRFRSHLAQAGHRVRPIERDPQLLLFE